MNDREYYENEKKDLFKEINNTALHRESFFRHILLVSATILGIVAGFHNANGHYLCYRWVFIASVALLGLSTLLSGIVVYIHQFAQERFIKKFHDALERAKEESLKINEDIGVKRTTAQIVAEWSALISLCAGIILLTLYVILTSFNYNNP